MPHISEPADTAPASWQPDADGLDVRLLGEAWSMPSAAELPSGAAGPDYLPGAAPSRPRRRRRRHRGPRHSTRITPNRFGHIPMQPRRFKAWRPPDFLRPAIAAQERAYFARGTNADPHPALLLRAQQGAIRAAQRRGLPVPLNPRKRVRSDLRESQDIFAWFLFKHVDLDSHLVGKPDGKGHIIPYSLTEMLEEIHDELAHHPNSYLEPVEPAETGETPEPRRAFSLSTLNRRIRDYKDANHITRWHHAECKVDDDGEEHWDGFVANMRVNNGFFYSLGYTDQDLEEEARRRREQRGYKTEASPPVHTTRYEAALRRDKRSRQHERERHRQARSPRQLISNTIDLCLRNTTPQDGADGDGLAILDVSAELRRELGTKDLSPERFRRTVMHRVRRRKSPRSPP